MKRITWHLTSYYGKTRTIVRIDKGAQQAFTKLGRDERMAITLDCVRVTEENIR